MGECVVSTIIDKHFSSFTSAGYGSRYVGYTSVFTQQGTLTQVRFRRYNYVSTSLNTSDIKIVVFDSSLVVKSINSTTFTGTTGNEIATSTGTAIAVSAGDGVLLWESGTNSNNALAAAVRNLISGGFYSDMQASFSVGSTVDVSNTVGQPGIELTLSGGDNPQAMTGGM